MLGPFVTASRRTPHYHSPGVTTVASHAACASMSTTTTTTTTCYRGDRYGLMEWAQLSELFLPMHSNTHTHVSSSYSCMSVYCSFFLRCHVFALAYVFYKCFVYFLLAFDFVFSVLAKRFAVKSIIDMTYTVPKKTTVILHTITSTHLNQLSLPKITKIG